jgi:FlaA1/EpsC-like NDP-sugar epimerase
MTAKPRVFIFGAGLGGRRARRFRGGSIQVLGFLDNDVKKHGTVLDGLRISGADALKAHEWDRIVIASMYDEEIFQQLIALGVPVMKIDVLDRAVLLGDDDPPWGCWIALLLMLVCSLAVSAAIWFF